MNTLQIFKLLLDLRKGWSSWTLVLSRILTAVGTIDATVFEGGLGGAILEASVKLVHMIPGFADVTEIQMTSFLVVVGANIYTWLRGKTMVPLAHKA